MAQETKLFTDADAEFLAYYAEQPLTSGLLSLPCFPQIYSKKETNTWKQSLVTGIEGAIDEALSVIPAGRVGKIGIKILQFADGFLARKINNALVEAGLEYSTTSIMNYLSIWVWYLNCDQIPNYLNYMKHAYPISSRFYRGSTRMYLRDLYMESRRMQLIVDHMKLKGERDNSSMYIMNQQLFMNLVTALINHYEQPVNNI